MKISDWDLSAVDFAGTGGCPPPASSRPERPALRGPGGWRVSPPSLEPEAARDHVHVAADRLRSTRPWTPSLTGSSSTPPRRDNAEMRCRIKISGKCEVVWGMPHRRRALGRLRRGGQWLEAQSQVQQARRVVGGHLGRRPVHLRVGRDRRPIDDPTHTNMSQCPMSVSAALSLECYAVLGWCGFCWLLRGRTRDYYSR